MLTLRNKKNRQVLIDSNLGVNQNVVVGGSMHVEGELSVQHITAPVEIQETEPVVVRGKLLAGYAIGIDAHEGSTVTSKECDMVVELYPHTHPFKNVPLKLMKDKDEVRKVGKTQTNNSGKTYALPVVHEQKTGETGPTG